MYVKRVFKEEMFPPFLLLFLGGSGSELCVILCKGRSIHLLWLAAVSHATACALRTLRHDLNSSQASSESPRKQSPDLQRWQVGKEESVHSPESF